QQRSWRAMQQDERLRSWIRSVFVFAALAALARPAVAGMITINFDKFPNGTSVPDGTVITTQYLPLGASFSSLAGGPRAIVGLGEASSLPNFLVGNPDSFQPITLDLTNPVATLGATLISVGDSTVTATAYGADLTTILDSVSVTNPGTG